MAVKSSTSIAFKEVEKLRKELGQIDSRRRQIFETLKNHPENIILFTEQTLKSMVDSKVWFEKATTKGSVYSQLTEMNIDTKSTNKLTAERKPIITATLTWSQYSDENINPVSTVKSKVSISSFNEIEPQILNGFKRTVLSDNDVKKKVLDIKEASLLEQIKQIKAERKKIK